MKTVAITIAAFAAAAALFGDRIQRDFVARAAPSITASPTDFSGVLAQNTLLRDNVELLLQGQINGAETVSEMGDGSLLICTDDGWLQRIRLRSAEPNLEKIMHVGSRPHVCKPYMSDGVVFVDVVKGLVVANLTTREQHIISTISDDGVPVRFADDLVVDSATGDIYYTDASSVQPWRSNGQDAEWMVFHSSKLDLMFGQATGRLLKYNANTHSTTTLMSGMWFANGITLDHSGDALLVAETFEFRVHKYFIRGSNAGTHHVFLRDLPGPVDGISHADGQGYFVTIPAVRTAIYSAAIPLVWVRRVLSMLPLHLWPPADPYGLVLYVQEEDAMVALTRQQALLGSGAEDAVTSGHAPGDRAGRVGVIRGSLHDPDGHVITTITSATVSNKNNGDLFLGGIRSTALQRLPAAVWKGFVSGLPESQTE